MNIQEIVVYLLPNGSDAWRSTHDAPPPESPSGSIACPTWAPDLFAVIGSIIERSGCYTLASPVRDALDEHALYLDRVAHLTSQWNANIATPPDAIMDKWAELLGRFGTEVYCQ